MQHGKFIQLGPRLRNDGVITVGGRVEKWMGMTYNLTQPVLLPYSSRFSKLYATSIHNDGHLGLSASASKVRLKYWIPRLIPLLKSIKFNCVPCRKMDEELSGQVMGPLRADRLKPSPAWSSTSLDPFGPLEIKGEVNKRSRGKGYGVLFN